MNNKKLPIVMIIVGLIYCVMAFIAKRTQEDESINDDNPYNYPYKPEKEEKLPLYVTTIKPMLAHILSFCALLVLSPIYAVIAIAIKIDDPGPVFFAQKRVGKDNGYFMCHKFRTMKVSAPHNVPTHQLKDPDQYITRVGKILRKTSLDEFPQFWDVFRHRMTLIGPRPALWNQEDLIAEREKYDAVMAFASIAGLAQNRGRDSLTIEEKAKYDGEYWSILRKGGFKAFLFDCRLFFETIISVVSHKDVVEGGVGAQGGERKAE